ncbi:MAG: hypothetical protein HN686_10775 [Bacteroidetes bacterium]|jgi:hypothetical protein|nr:hypothetical protein [Bacteroidota bacterium]MBT7464459.1 hypothetical protein [Bacteroidota bacterium]
MKLIMTHGKRLFQSIFITGLVLITSGFFTSGSFAQDLTSSPYSRFGVGDLLLRNYGRGEAMGGLGVGISSDKYLNLVNPAGIGDLLAEQFLFEVGATDRLTRFSTTDLGKTSNNLNFSYLGLGFPITKWWKGSIGVLPYSGVGYSMFDTKIDPSIGEVRSQFDGEGGLSQFSITQSFRPMKYLTLGVNFSYLFGPLSHIKSLAFPADSSYFSTTSISSAIVGDIRMNYGAQVNIPIKNDFFFTLGGTYEHQSNIKAESRQLVYATGQGLIDTLYYHEDVDNSIVLPMGYGGGFSFGKKNKFTVGADYKVQNWKDASFLGQADSMANSQVVIVGMEYIPDAFSPMSYAKRIQYRAGIKLGKTQLQLNNTQLQEIGINFGVGLPIRAQRLGRASSLNISAEIGKRGTINNNLISEFYGLISIQLTLRDRWFFKIKYD